MSEDAAENAVITYISNDRHSCGTANTCMSLIPKISPMQPPQSAANATAATIALSTELRREKERDRGARTEVDE